ncbi:hypothetical protein BKA70DRAFT_865203 [Coprinopsis sp. MPI-PUGE-AT-0042]|nr:hypothetical protein BKA70DRAFT_865203 [Coprinopsis sp. MPI-PUGE-AT-0042]
MGTLTTTPPLTTQMTRARFAIFNQAVITSRPSPDLSCASFARACNSASLPSPSTSASCSVSSFTSAYTPPRGNFRLELKPGTVHHEERADISERKCKREEVGCRRLRKVRTSGVKPSCGCVGMCAIPTLRTALSLTSPGCCYKGDDRFLVSFLVSSVMDPLTEQRSRLGRLSISHVPSLRTLAFPLLYPLRPHSPPPMYLCLLPSLHELIQKPLPGALRERSPGRHDAGL